MKGMAAHILRLTPWQDTRTLTVGKRNAYFVALKIRGFLFRLCASAVQRFTALQFNAQKTVTDQRTIDF
jgi:hypothetical protein